MSSVVVPTPNSSSLERRAPRLTERARALLTALNLHFAGVAALAVLALWLAVRLFVLWQGLAANNSEALSNERVQLTAAKIAARPLEGLDAKVVVSTQQADLFYGQRLPYAYSQVLTELGVLTKKSGVHLSRVQYTQAPALTGRYELNEVRMDASVSGDYRSVVGFVNLLERDRMFFVISAINLTGQQTGQVNLRIRITTFLRTMTPDEINKELAAAEAANKQAGGAQ
jgi:hypothetical protein